MVSGFGDIRLVRTGLSLQLLLPDEPNSLDLPFRAFFRILLGFDCKTFDRLDGSFRIDRRAIVSCERERGAPSLVDVLDRLHPVGRRTFYLTFKCHIVGFVSGFAHNRVHDLFAAYFLVRWKQRFERFPFQRSGDFTCSQLVADTRHEMPPVMNLMRIEPIFWIQKDFF